jgi:hypothetical protein
MTKQPNDGTQSANLSFDYAIHSDFLIHWTGKDFDRLHEPDWSDSHRSQTDPQVAEKYLARLKDILEFGLWMTTERETKISESISIPATPKCCFTELKLSQSRRHAKQYGRLGIGVKRPFAFKRGGRPLVYYEDTQVEGDRFLQACGRDLQSKALLNFFKPMNSSKARNYDFYAESEWRIVFTPGLLDGNPKLVVNPRDKSNDGANQYLMNLPSDQQDQLSYLIPLDGWLGIIIYPSLRVKNMAQRDPAIAAAIKRIKTNPSDRANKVEDGTLPVEVDLDACRNF